MHPSLRPLSWRALLVAALASLAACGGDGPTATPAPVPVARVDVTAASPTLVIGETLQLHATPKSATGEPLIDRTLTWTSIAPTWASVTATGVVTALREGAVRIVVTADGVEGGIDLLVVPVPAAAVTLDRTTLTLTEGGEGRFAAVVRDTDGAPLEGRALTWSVDDPAIVTVDNAGGVRAVREGQARIVARHGDLEAAATVTVQGIFVADLVFHANSDGMRLFRTDLRADVATSVAMLPVAGAWQAASSPAGSRITFTCAEPGPTICTSAPDGSDLRALTGGDTSNEDEPAWSPDGTRILFRRWPHGATAGQFNPTDLWVMDADGGNAVNLTADALVQGEAAWSPVPVEGTYRIVFVQEAVVDGFVTSRLYTMRADGTDRRPLTTAGAHTDAEPAWSPDGRTVVFVRSGGTELGALWAVDLVTGAERRFFAAALGDAVRHPAWSPDGRYLAFASRHEPSPSGNYRWQVYTVRANGADLRRRTTDDLDKEQPTWLPRP